MSIFIINYLGIFGSIRIFGDLDRSFFSPVRKPFFRVSVRTSEMAVSGPRGPPSPLPSACQTGPGEAPGGPTYPSYFCILQGFQKRRPFPTNQKHSRSTQ